MKRKPKRVIWKPQEKQAAFMQRWEHEALYGGAAGGGKTDALLIEALRQVHIPYYRGILFRKTIPQLADMVDRSITLYKGAFPRAKFNGNKHCWTFPDGAKIYFGYMQSARDKTNYQGKSYDFIGFDELTHFTWEEYSYMLSRNRPHGPGTRVYMRAATNPGGIGHGWVMNRFIAPAPPLTTMYQDMTVQDPAGKTIRMRKSRVFVPASVFDNQVLLDNDPSYLANLAQMDEADKQALLYGDWNVFAGQVFREWVDDPKAYQTRLWTHVIEPFRVPEHWRILMAFDWGFTKPFSVGWFAVDENGRYYHIREHYGWNGTPNTGVEWTPQEIARRILDIEQSDPNLRGRRISRVADPSIFGGHVSQADAMGREGVYFTKADNTRLAGKMQVHYRLRFNDVGVPMLYVFNTCQQFIRTFKALVYDETNVEDVESRRQEDHIYDMLRYACMENRISPPRPEEPRPLRDDPLDLRQSSRVLMI